MIQAIDKPTSLSRSFYCSATCMEFYLVRKYLNKQEVIELIIKTNINDNFIF